jgi:muramoyltetrapeptide carboxypeptidase
MIKPPAIKKGDTLGIVAPAGSVESHDLEKGMRRLCELGFRIRVGTSVHKGFRMMAGSDSDRAHDIMQMFSDPEIKAIVCARGGYGSGRVLPYLDSELIRAHPKVFVGSSDVTFLLLYLTQNCDMVAFHGPMVAPDFGKEYSSVTEEYFLKALTQIQPLGAVRLQGARILRKGHAEAPLVGGCLSVLCSALGTSYEPQTQDKILFLEDVKEAPYRIDRMLTHLKDSGKFNGVRGVLFGEMRGCHPERTAGYLLEEIILDALREVDGPIVLGISSGHSRDNLTLPLGITIRLDTDSPKQSRERSSSSESGITPAAAHDPGKAELIRFEEGAVGISPEGDVSGVSP